MIGQSGICAKVHPAVVCTVATAASGQIRLSQRSGGDERSNQGQSKDCQQRNGEKSAQ